MYVADLYLISQTRGGITISCHPIYECYTVEPGYDGFLWDPTKCKCKVEQNVNLLELETFHSELIFHHPE